MPFKRLALSLCLVLALAAPAFAAKATVHFFVIPAAIPSERLHSLNAFLVQHAGGYTVSRSTGGDTTSFGTGYAPENLSYTVSAPGNIGPEIKAFLRKNCGQEKVFLLTWPAERLDN